MADEPSNLTIDKVQSGPNTVSIADAGPLSAYMPIIFEVSSSSPFINPIVQAEVQYWDGSNWLSFSPIKKEEITVSGNKLFRFEVSGLLQTILSSDKPAETTFSAIITGGDNVARKFRVRFAQIYEDSFGTIIEQEQITSSTYWVSNSVIPPNNANQDLSEWTISTASANKKFLTHMPNNMELWSGDEIQLTFLADNQTVNYAMYYEEYNLLGVAQGTTTTSATTITNRYGILPINSLEVLSNASNISKVDVWVQNTTGGVRVTEKKTFIVNNKLNPGTRIQWLNSLGGIDQFNFINFKTIERITGRINFTKSLPISYTRNDRGGVTIGSNKIERWTLSSGTLTQDESEWLDTITDSVDASINQGNDFYEPILVENEQTLIYDTMDLPVFTLTFVKARTSKTHIG